MLRSTRFGQDPSTAMVLVSKSLLLWKMISFVTGRAFT